MLIDTHCHLNFKDFKDDYDKVINQAFTKDVWMINIGSDLPSSQRALDLAGKYIEGVYAGIGIHPSEASKFTGGTLELYIPHLRRLAFHNKVVVIGESGLDYSQIKNEEERENQITAFKAHLELAAELDKPISIHCREAHSDMLKILKEIKIKHPSLKGVNHFFSGSIEDAKALFEIDFLISFAGVITFSRDYDEVIKQIPLERIMVETDAPFVAPEPHRGKRNEPLYVEYVAKKIAEIKGVDFKEVSEVTTQNARLLFNI